MLYYFDSSAVVKRYAPEQGSEWVKSIVDPGSGHTVYLAQIGVIEVAAALSRKVRTNELSQEDYEAAFFLFMMDVRNEVYIIAQLSDQIVEKAVELTRQYPLRGYDAVHLGTAIILNTSLLEAGLSPLNFVSADRTLCEAAQGDGFSTNNPNDQ